MAVYSNYRNDTNNYLEGCHPDMNAIPSYATLNEMAFHVVEASETDFNKMMIECGVEELYHLEESKTEMIYEEGKVAELKDKAANFFKELWKKVQTMFDNAIKWFQDKANSFRKKVIEGIDKNLLQKRVDNIPSDKSFGTTYNYQNIKEFSAKVIKNIESCDNEIDKIRDNLISQSKNETPSSEAAEKEIKAAITSCIDGILNSTSHNGDSTSGLSKLLKDKIRGEQFQVSGKWVKDNFKKGVNIYTEVISYSETKQQLKRDYKILQRSFNDAIKMCKKADNSKMFEASAFTKAIKGYKTLRQIAVYSQQAIISCLNERYSFFRGIMFKTLAVKKASSDSKAVGESTTVDSISSLFDWD